MNASRLITAIPFYDIRLHIYMDWYICLLISEFVS